MHTSMSFNPELGLYAWLDTVAYILDCELSNVRKDEAAWKVYFDAGKRPVEAILERKRVASE